MVSFSKTMLDTGKISLLITKIINTQKKVGSAKKALPSYWSNTACANHFNYLFPFYATRFTIQNKFRTIVNSYRTMLSLAVFS